MSTVDWEGSPRSPHRKDSDGQKDRGGTYNNGDCMTQSNRHSKLTPAESPLVQPRWAEDSQRNGVRGKLSGPGGGSGFSSKTTKGFHLILKDVQKRKYLAYRQYVFHPVSHPQQLDRDPEAFSHFDAGH